MGLHGPPSKRLLLLLELTRRRTPPSHRAPTLIHHMPQTLCAHVLQTGVHRSGRASSWAHACDSLVTNRREAKPNQSKQTGLNMKLYVSSILLMAAWLSLSAAIRPQLGSGTRPLIEGEWGTVLDFAAAQRDLRISHSLFSRWGVRKGATGVVCCIGACGPRGSGQGNADGQGTAIFGSSPPKPHTFPTCLHPPPTSPGSPTCRACCRTLPSAAPCSWPPTRLGAGS